MSVEIERLQRGLAGTDNYTLLQLIAEYNHRKKAGEQFSRDHDAVYRIWVAEVEKRVRAGTLDIERDGTRA